MSKRAQVSLAIRPRQFRNRLFTASCVARISFAVEYTEAETSDKLISALKSYEDGDSIHLHSRLRVNEKAVLYLS